MIRRAVILTTLFPALAADYTPQHSAVTQGGGAVQSTSYFGDSTIGGFTAIAASVDYTARIGVIAELNDAPLANVNTFVSRPGRPIKILKSALLANDTDFEGDAIQFVSIPSLSENGVSLNLVGAWVVYDAPSNNFGDDAFTYTINDGFSDSVGVVSIIITPFDGTTLNISLVNQEGDNFLRIFGIPGRTYQIQTTTDITPPIAWSNLGSSRVTPAHGVIEVLDTAPPTTRFYRAIEP